MTYKRSYRYYKFWELCLYSIIQINMPIKI
uniref:Uncharacterized protein n=1 Tax=viral metagenome TaxID=1070528 RepID=A0A6C0H8S6_9ZZZZ